MTTHVSAAPRLESVERGSGAPILFVHGWPTGANVWRHQLDGLSASHRVIAVDLPGFGATPPVERPSMHLFATAVRDFIDERGLRDVFLIGWSMGAGVVMSYNEHFGGHALRALGIVDDCPKLYPDDEWQAGVDTTFSREAVARWKATWEAGDRRAVIEELTAIEFKDPGKHADDIEWLVAESLRADPACALDALLEVMELDFRASLRSVPVPALLLYGAASKMTTPANRTFMETTIPNARLVVFEDSAHNPMLEEPDRFNHEVDAFARATAAGMPA
jgi:pimeloyl-ACP methyl ester carboxylesterase